MLTVFFDLDGTLLPMDYDTFEKGYFSLLVKKLVPYGLTPEEIVSGIWAGTKAMIANDGARTNEEVFWARFGALVAERCGDLSPAVTDFYTHEFDEARHFCGSNPQIPAMIRSLRERGCRLVVATNPLFPRIALNKRLSWAGLDPEDFAYISSYENSHFCKPNPAYYRELLEKLALDPAEVVMVGNDATEDLAAEEAGIRTFLLTDCLINRQEVSLEDRPHGDLPAARAWLEAALQGHPPA